MWACKAKKPKSVAFFLLTANSQIKNVYHTIICKLLSLTIENDRFEF